MSTDPKTPRFLAGIPFFLLLAAMAVGIRLHNLASPPVEFHPARQYSGLITSTTLRWMMFERSERPDLARHVTTQKIGLEPPLHQFLTALAWEALDREDTRVPRLLSLAAWMLASWPLALVGLRFGDRPGMLAALVFWWFWPYGIAVSRAFMPEAFLFLCLFWVLWLLVRGETRPRIMAVALLSTALVKPGFAVPTLIAWLALGNRSRGSRIGWIALLVAVTGLYSVVRIGEWGSIRFFPSLLFEFSTWKGHLLMLDTVYGAGLLTTALAGGFLLPPEARRWVLGSVVGWLAVIVFNTELATHLDHYHLALAPAVVICLACLGSAAGDLLAPKVWKIVAVVLCLIGLREGRLLIRGLDPGIASSMPAETASTSTLLSRANRFGARMGVDRRVLCLSPAYGQILAFHGNCIVHPWLKPADRRHLALRGSPDADLDAAELLARERRANPIRWFAVTDVGAFARDQELQRLLRQVARHVDAGNTDGILFEFVDR